MLEDLAQLFRVALADAGTSVSLDEEIDLAQRYLAIEQIRYGQRLQLSWDIDPRVGSARVPPLVLQPLVENAVRHGVEPALEGARIWVQAECRRGQAVVLVSNTVSDAPSTRARAWHCTTCASGCACCTMSPGSATSGVKAGCSARASSCRYDAAEGDTGR